MNSRIVADVFARRFRSSRRARSMRDVSEALAPRGLEHQRRTSAVTSRFASVHAGASARSRETISAFDSDRQATALQRSLQTGASPVPPPIVHARAVPRRRLPERSMSRSETRAHPSRRAQNRRRGALGR